MMEDRELLMIPGPVSVDDEILEALARPGRAHYGDAWTRHYKRAASNMREVFKTTGDVHLVFGSGMAGVEMCIASVLSPGDEVLIPSNGLFGDRMVEVATANRLQVHSFRPGLAEAITAAQVRGGLGGASRPATARRAPRRPRCVHRPSRDLGRHPQRGGGDLPCRARARGAGDRRRHLVNRRRAL